MINSREGYFAPGFGDANFSLDNQFILNILATAGFIPKNDHLLNPLYSGMIY
jgi:hypothetical protein